MMQVPVSGVNAVGVGASGKLAFAVPVTFVQFTHVLFKVKIATKTFAAHLTRERLFVVVGMHVKCEIVDLMERLRTDCAFVGFLAAVGKFVVFVVAFLVKALPAIFADERFVAGVDSSVSVKSGRSVESFAACVTFVWFF